MKAAIFIIAVLVLSGIVIAEDSVIIATDVTSVDALVASAAGTDDGTPVLIAENGEVTSDVMNALEDRGIKNVMIVGGPSVVSEQTEASLRLKYKVARLWGMERTGTAIEIAKYFWPEGSECIVLVGDTKNSAQDTGKELKAANYGAHKKCPVIPVPDGNIPAEVLSLMQDINVKDVYVVGTLTEEAKASLSNYTVIEKADFEDDIANDTRELKLVIIASPEWKEATAVGSLPLRNTIVRMVSNASQLDPVIALIKEKNITDIRVVGKPILAQEIAAALEAEGIAVDKVSGENASEMAKLAWLRVRARWQERKVEALRERAQVITALKEKLKEWKNESVNELEDEEIAADDTSNSAVSSALKAKITELKATLTTIERNIDSGNIDEARRLIAELKNGLEKVKWQNRAVIASRIQEALNSEEQTTEAMEVSTATATTQIGEKISALRRCGNTVAVRALVEEAKSLSTSIAEAKQQNDDVLAARLAIRQKNLIQIANRIMNICENKGTVSVDVNAVIGRHHELTSATP